MSFLIDPFRVIKPPEGDEYTKLLLHFDGDDGATTTVDSSASAHAITMSGATLATDQSKFGGSAYKSSGSSSLLTVDPSDDWDFGTSDFTIDFWYRPEISSYSNVVAIDNQGGTINITGNTGGGKGGVTATNTATTVISASGDQFYIGNWYHIALVRSGNNFRFYRDGILYGSGTHAAAFGNDVGNLLIGGSFAPVTGRIDEFRVSKGIARWTADFTPPAEPYGP